MKVTWWALKTPLGWLVEGARGLFTHTKDVRKASRYGTMTKAQKAVGRARHSVEVGAVTYERIRVPKVRERRLVLKEKLPTGDEWLVETERGRFRGTDDKNEATVYSSSHDAVMAKRRAAKVCGGRVKVSEIQVSVEDPLEEVREEDLWPKEPPYFVIAKGKVPGRRYLEALSFMDRAVWTKFHEHAIHYSSYTRAKATLEKMAREDRGGGLHAATVEHIYVEEKTDEELTPEPRRRWAVALPNGRYALFGGGPAQQVNLTEATKFSVKNVAQEWATRVGGVLVAVLGKSGASSGSVKRSEKIRPPAREGNASQGPSVPLHWVVEKVIDGKAHFLKENAKGKKPIFAKEVEDATKFCSSVHAREAAKKIAGGREAPIYMTVKKWEPRNGDLVRFDHLEEGDRSCGTGVVQATGLTSKDGKTVRVRWSRSSTPGRMDDRDEIMFHEPSELRPLTDAEERVLEDEARAKPIFEAILHELPEDPKVRLPMTVLKGLKLMRRTIRKLRELDDESEEPRRLKWDSAEDRRAVLSASLWIRSISKAIVKPKKRKKEKLRERNRGAYHDMLERAMDETKQGKGFLPRFVELIHEDMIDLGPTESG